MVSLYDYLEDIYYQIRNYLIKCQLDEDSLEIIKNTDFSQLIKDEDLCLKLIMSTYEFKEDYSLLAINRNRAKHIIITWLLGIGVRQIIPSPSNGFEEMYGDRIWLLSATLHDYGYFLNDIKSYKTLDSYTTDFDLLTDDYSYCGDLRCLNNMSTNPMFHTYFPYSYDLIKRYYKYKQIERGTGEDPSDHGILGGCVAFSKYCSAVINQYIFHKKEKVWLQFHPSDSITQIQKIACITAASHNIYKSDDQGTDFLYDKHGLALLKSDGPIVICKKYYTLLLLSLVDTIECDKRFSKKNDPGNYLQSDTLLARIKVNVSEIDKSISLDFSELFDYIRYVRKNSSLESKLADHLDKITKLGNWTEFEAKYIDSDQKGVVIQLK